ncbi:hypothetical protein, partial [Thiolapillus sp.]|uniref:IS66 family transposase n=2 Tax=Thiolapillus sp. TaxID=2017437 RepID=UPI003AF68799
MIDFGTSQSPKSTRPLTTYLCPSRPGHQALRNNFASSLLLRTWLPYDWTPRSEAYFVFPLAQGTPGKQCGLAATGDYQPSLRSPWLAANDRICCMKPVLDTSPNPSAPASFPSADLLRILEEKDRSLEEKDRLLVQQQALLKEREALIAEQQKLLRLMEEQLRLARLRKFGARSEKLPFQGELFDEAELEVSLEDVEQALAEAEAEPKKPRKRRTKADGFD